MRINDYLNLRNGAFPYLKRKAAVSHALYKTGRLAILAKSFNLPPSWIQIETTTKCNLRCTTCLRSRTCPDMNHDMTLDVFRSIIDQSVCSRFVKPTIKLIGLGEPLLNPRIDSMVKYVKRKGLQAEIVSNFTYVNPKILADFVEAQLDYLSISVDAASPQAFEKIRVGAKFGDVLNNVKSFLEIRNSMDSVWPKVFFRATINQDNFGEVPAIVELAQNVGVDGVVFSNQIVSGKDNNQYQSLMTSHFDKARGKTSVWAKQQASTCPAMDRCYITYDGKVMPCNFLMEIIPREEYPQFEFGDITRNSLRKVWFSKIYKQFRVGKALGFHPYFCKSCTNIP